jgi:nucleoside 2-deoxyribosyltransferase
MMTSTTCPIWKTPATEHQTTRDGRHVDSSRAGGEYFVSGTAEALLDNLAEPDRVRLTSWLVEQRRLGVVCPQVSSDTLKEIKQRRSPSVSERADALLRYLTAKSDMLGDVVKFYSADNTKKPVAANELLAWTASRGLSEVITLAEYCGTEGWIEHRVTAPTALGDGRGDAHELMLRPPGYARLATLDATGASSKQAFVAMWFDDSVSDAYENGIALAIRDAGYEPLRIDRKEHNNKIDDEIIAEIRRSRFVIADFTQGDSGARGGVYYEAGFAHGHGIPVIFTCREDIIGKVHFDTRQYNHITWKAADDLRQRLAQRISATIGDGPLKKTGSAP